jgi:hypothetical protein
MIWPNHTPDGIRRPADGSPKPSVCPFAKKMKYWTISFATSRRYGDVKTPHDADGTYYPDRKGVICRASLVLADWNTPAKQPPDCICCFEHFIVSRRAAELLGRFKIDELARVVPLRILDPRPEFANNYCCAFFPRYHTGCVDLELSKHTKYSDGTPMLFEEPVVLARHLPAYDLFGAQYVGIVCADPVREAIAEAGLLNFEFGELRQSEANQAVVGTSLRAAPHR